MSPLLRGALAVAGLAGAFAAGFFLKPVPAVRTAAAQVPAETNFVAKPLTPEDKVPEIQAPPIHDAAVRPATVLGTPEAAPTEKFDPTNPEMAMIRQALGHKTTILDRNEPIPPVLASAGTSPPIPKADLELPPPPGPVPMGGPMPRLDPPPMLALPSIDPPPPPAPPPSVPAPPKPVPLVNARAVALDFEVTRSGPSKVTAVELWTTRDGGATWAKTDRMTGCVSPFRTRLGSDGEYGFRLVMESESGMRTPAPKPGDRPDVRRELDTTPPNLAGLSIGPVAGSPDKVQIQWEMFDAHLDSKGVRIEYSTDGRTWHPAVLDPTQGPHQIRGGTWTAVWTVPPGLPHRVMFRLTSRDQAGNEATAELPKQVSIDLVAPAGKVSGVRTSDPEVGPMPREVILPLPAKQAKAPPARPLTLVELLTDSGWKPSTATPDSCRWAPGPRARRSPFDGAIDVVIPPGRPPAPVVARGR